MSAENIESDFVCGQCGAPIEPTREWHRFCSKACRYKWRSKRMRKAMKLLNRVEREAQDGVEGS